MQSRDDVAIRGVEAIFGVALAVALLVAFTSGWFTSAALNFSEWYALQVSGILDIDVVSTTVQLPQLAREDLPLLPTSAPVFSAPGNNVGAD